MNTTIIIVIKDLIVRDIISLIFVLFKLGYKEVYNYSKIYKCYRAETTFDSYFSIDELPVY